MLIHRSSREAIEEAARQAGVRVEVRPYRGAWRAKCRPLFVQRPVWPRYMRRGTSYSCSRLPSCLCWHGFAAFFKALFELSPRASMRTPLAFYQGRESFYRQYEATAHHNIGSMSCPLEIADACDCALLAHGLECGFCGVKEGVDLIRHNWTEHTVVCQARKCRKMMRTIKALRER